VILIGEMRDLETISMAISAAETGHLVFGTLHTIAALEIMIVNHSIQKLLIENQIPSISTVMRMRTEGMALFDQYLADLVRAGTVEEQEAYRYVEDEPGFRRYLKGRMATADMGGIIG
jgi:Tfp pilus assembly pilus retraction ATPase PilT